MPNNSGEATVDEVAVKVLKLANAKMDDLADQAATITNSAGGTIKNNTGTKSKKQK